MRKHVATVAVALTCLAAAAGCSPSDDASSTGRSSVGGVAVEGGGDASPGNMRPPVNDPGASASLGTSGPTNTRVGRVLSGARDKVAAAQTCKAVIDVEIGGTRVSSSQAQLRLGANPVTRMITVTEGAYYTALGLPVPSAENRKSETLIIGTAVYSSVPPTMRDLYNGKGWTKLTLGGGEGTTNRPQDFASQLALLQRSGDIREVGQDTVDGIATTHFSGTISMILLLENSADSLGVSENEYETIRKIWDSLGFDHAQIELWLGPDGLPVKQTTTTHVAQAGKSSTTTTTTRYSDWGSPIDDAPPPADDIEEIVPGPSSVSPQAPMF